MDTLRQRARSLRRTPTDAEALLWRHLRRGQLGEARFRRQHPVAGYILDFACPAIGLAIELDGGQHVENAAYDERRSTLLAAAGWRVLRFWNDDVLLRTDDVLAEVHRAIESIGDAQAPTMRSVEVLTPRIDAQPRSRT